jgi:hypothetical protein
MQANSQSRIRSAITVIRGLDADTVGSGVCDLIGRYAASLDRGRPEV